MVWCLLLGVCGVGRDGRRGHWCCWFDVFPRTIHLIKIALRWPCPLFSLDQMEQRKLNEVFILLISKQTDTRVWVVHFGLCTLYYNICPIDLNELQALLHYDKTWDTFHKISDCQPLNLAKIDFQFTQNQSITRHQ